jgi:hypothetical protein
MAKYFMSQSRIRKVNELVPYHEGALTERGEKVYSHLEIKLIPASGTRFIRVIRADNGIGFTEEWIEDTIAGALLKLELDYPTDAFEILRHAPNEVEFRYIGSRGVVQ